MSEHQKMKSPPANYYAHTEFGRLSFEISRLDALSLSSLSAEEFSNTRHKVLTLMTVARGTEDPEKIDSGMQTFMTIKKECHRRERD